MYVWSGRDGYKKVWNNQVSWGDQDCTYLVENNQVSWGDQDCTHLVEVSWGDQDCTHLVENCIHKLLHTTLSAHEYSDTLLKCYTHVPRFRCAVMICGTWRRRSHQLPRVSNSFEPAPTLLSCSGQPSPLVCEGVRV